MKKLYSKNILMSVNKDVNMRKSNIEYYGVSFDRKRTVLNASDIRKSSSKFVVIPERLSKSLNLQEVIAKLSSGKEIIMDILDQTTHNSEWTATYSVEGTNIKSARPDNYQAH